MQRKEKRKEKRNYKMTKRKIRAGEIKEKEMLSIVNLSNISSFDDYFC